MIHDSSFTTKVFLHFADGTTFPGLTHQSPHASALHEGIWGEAAFTTGMMGYQETITDPSFLGQHIIFSYPHIGNYPPNPEVMQSWTTHATSILAPTFSPNSFLMELSLPLVCPLDTRSLVKYLAQGKGSHISVLTSSSCPPSFQEFSPQRLICNQIERVSQKDEMVITKGEHPIVAINLGMKKSILTNLQQLEFPLVVVGCNASPQEILRHKPRMIFLSNGPGDPALLSGQILLVKELLKTNIPLRAICLGHQLTALALGARTFRLPFGHRGCNHPVLDHLTGKVLITSQNHGYAVDRNSFNSLAKNNFLGKEFFIHYSSLFDQSVEGLSSTDHMIKTVQFHPEASPGPQDAYSFFQEMKDFLSSSRTNLNSINIQSLVRNRDLKSERPDLAIPYKKVLVVGSGPIRIGQASEFDYSGTQACRVLKEQGIKVILLNSNPATIMTDKELAYRTYIEPITLPTVKRIIERERVDAVLSTMGGQTALNLCMELEQEGFLHEHNVTLLGANFQTILRTEDREIFSQELEKLGYKTGKRYQVFNQTEALMVAKNEIQFPLIIRRNFALGGQGAVTLENEEQLRQFLSNETKFPLTLEKSLHGYKEIELEIMVDCEQNGVVICSIENIDPCGIHTGDSITVAPAQTISDRCYQKLRTAALEIGKAMGVVAGGANVQFAIHPQDEDDIVVIEMNPRVSRSSALASKATGYPIAKISTLLALGFTLKDILNDITKSSPVSFEPTMDYVAVKIPLFPFSKFPASSPTLGPQMRSVGEVLALGSNFQEAFMKALRSLEMNLDIPSLYQLKDSPLDWSMDLLENRLKEGHELSLLTVLEALRKGMSQEKIHQLSHISPWFIEQMQLWLEMEKEISPKILEDMDLLLRYKSIGFSDRFLAQKLEIAEESILQLRLRNQLFPSYNAVDTCSGEFLAQTPYFYSTYQKANEATPFSKDDGKKSIVILGSGPNRIGQGIEFDYSCVKAAWALKDESIHSILINSNPETVSTDYDCSDRLYLAPLYVEDIFDILHWEKPAGVIASFSGQTGIHLRRQLETTFRHQYLPSRFLGPSWETIEATEDREKFNQILQKLPLHKTKSLLVKGFKELLKANEEIGYPVIIRPSYVIGGESMFIFDKAEDIDELPSSILQQLRSEKIEFLVENYLENAFEYDVDLIRDSQGNCLFTLCEHIEFAGVHSGDSGMITPPVHLSSSLKRQLKDISIQLAQELQVVGPINFQYAIKEGRIYCLEANPRGSRTLPFLSKAHSLSLPHYATLAMIGKPVPTEWKENLSVFFVKQSTFPFDRFLQDDIILGPKMRSTGETMGMDADRDQAILKSFNGNYPKIRKVGKILISLADTHKYPLSPYLKPLHNMGYQFYATSGTYEFIKRHGLSCIKVAKIGERGKTILDVLKEGEMIMVFNTPSSRGSSKMDGESIRNTSIGQGIPCFTRIENIKSVVESLIGSQNQSSSPINLQEISS